MKIPTRTLSIPLVLGLVTALLSGCSGGSAEDTKPPADASYYKGDMKPRGQAGGAEGTAGAAGTKAATQ